MTLTQADIDLEIAAEHAAYAKRLADGAPVEHQPRRDYAPYRSSVLRHPQQPPVTIDVTQDPELVELSSPAFGERDITVSGKAAARFDGKPSATCSLCRAHWRSRCEVDRWRPAWQRSVRSAATCLLPVTSTGQVQAQIRYMGPIKAPIRKGDQVATLRISTTDTPATNDIPLYAATDIETGNFAMRGLGSLMFLAFGWAL